MKNKFFSVLLVILLTIGAVFSSYILADRAVKLNNGSAGESTSTQLAVTENDGERVLLVEDKQRDYHFYTQGDKVIFVHKEKEYVYEDWSEEINLDVPKLAYDDMDDDGEEEILVQVAAYANDGEIYHNVYVFNHMIDRYGEETFRINAFTADTIVKMFDERIKIEITQDKNCEKNGLVAFARRYDQINYDRETGLPSSYYNCFRCLQDSNGRYMKVSNWQKGRIEVFIDNENKIYITMPITMVYEDGSVQDAGFAKFKAYVSEEFENNITAKSMSFVANKEYGLYGYNFDGQEWTATLNNASKTVPADRNIDFIQIKQSFDIDIETVDFSGINGDANMLSAIYVDEQSMELVAKKGCSFSQRELEENRYSVRMLTKGASSQTDYDISYKATIYTNDNGDEVLKILFDKKYNKVNMREVTVSFGVK